MTAPASKPRLYYDCPLKAAWMDMRHGMDIRLDHSEGQRFLDAITTHGVDTFGGAIAANNYTRFYIHPDSLPLLEPRRGDLVFYEFGFFSRKGEAWDEVKALIRHNDEGYPYTGDGEAYVLCDSGESFGISRLKRIIQRKGLPFHWPESEAA